MSDEASLYSALSKMGVVENNDLDSAWKEAKESGKNFSEIILENDLLTDEDLGKMVADILKVPFVRLSGMLVKREVAQLLPEDMATNRRVLVFRSDDVVHLAMEDPEDLATIELVRKKMGKEVRIYYVTRRDLKTALLSYLADPVSAFQEEVGRPAVTVEGLISKILIYAYRAGAVEVQIEPQGEFSVIRYLTDGGSVEIFKLPIAWQSKFIEYVSGLPPGGIFDFDVRGIELIRVIGSVSRVAGGDRVRLRMLTESIASIGFMDLGLSDEDREIIQTTLSKPYGMTWIIGPEGSGKTTTAYALVKLLKREGKKINTVEDPIEVPLKGVNQTQINPLTAPSVELGIQLAQKQDPDVILVGETVVLKDANIEMKTATSGCRVITTLNDGDTGKVFRKLADVGCDPFLVASSSDMFIAVRLVRKICPACKTSKLVDIESLNSSLRGELEKKLAKKVKIRVYFGKGCEVCGHIGYRGRMGVFEIMVLNEKLRSMIISKQDGGEIKKEAINSGMKSLMEDGWTKVRKGLTTVDELQGLMIEK